MRRRFSWEDSLASNIVGLSVLLALVAVVAVVWLMIKAINLVIRVMVQHPRNKVLWFALGLGLVSFIADGLTNGQSDLLNLLAGVSVGSLLVCAKGLELYYDNLLQPDQGVTADSVIHDVLHEPWWQAA